MEKVQFTNRYTKYYLTLVLCLVAMFGVLIVQAQPTFTDAAGGSHTAGGDETDVVVWASGLINSNCAGDFTVTFTQGGAGASVFQWSYDNVNWNDIASGGAVPAGAELYLQLFAANLSNGQDVSVVDVVVVEPFSVKEVAVSHYTCHDNVNTGAVEIVAACGTQDLGVVTYTWTGLEGSYSNTGASISGLAEGDYSCTVSNGFDVDVVYNVTIVNPAELSFVVSGDNYTCDGGVDNGGTDGEIIVTPVGGVADYDIDVVGSVSGEIDALIEYVPNQTFSDLSAENYTVTVVDANGCTATNNSEIVVVQDDDAGPTFTVPVDRSFTPLEYNGGHDDNDELYIDNTVMTFTGVADGQIADFSVACTNHSNVRLRLVVSQLTTDKGWSQDDSISVHVSYDGVEYVPLWIDKAAFNGVYDDIGEGANESGSSLDVPTDPLIDLGDQADFNDEVYIRIYYNIKTVNLKYEFSQIRVIGAERLHAVLVSQTGDVEDEDDLVSGSENATFEDDITWFCDDVDAEEFLIQRTWTAVDACNHPTVKVQNIRVGTPPRFEDGTFPNNTTFNYCDLQPTIVAPTPIDDCFGGVVSWDVLEIDDAYGDGDLTGVLFAAGASYTIEWTVSDALGLTYSQVQEINFNNPITATIETKDDVVHYCVGEAVEFIITPAGGTGSFDENSFNRIGGSWNVLDGTYTYIETDGWAAVGDVRFLIDVSDIAVDDASSCTEADFKSAEISIHGHISTLELNRN